MSVRYDRFEVDSVGAAGYGAQSGHAWTAAYVFNADAHWRFTLEWLQVISSSSSRADLGGPPLLTETQLQLAVRYALGSRQLLSRRRRRRGLAQGHALAVAARSIPLC